MALRAEKVSCSKKGLSEDKTLVRPGGRLGEHRFEEEHQKR